MKKEVVFKVLTGNGRTASLGNFCYNCGQIK